MVGSRRACPTLLIVCWLSWALLGCGGQKGPNVVVPTTGAPGPRPTAVAVVVATADTEPAQPAPTVTLAARRPTVPTDVDEEVINVVPPTQTAAPTGALPTDIGKELINVQPTATRTTDVDEELVNIVPSTPAPEITEAPPPEDLEQELFVGLGGGDGGFCFSPPAEGGLPAVEGQVFNYHMGYLCLWGFGLGETLYVELYDPQGLLAGAKEYPVVEERSGVGVVQVLPWFAGRPTGEWSVAASTAGTSLWQSFYVSEPELPVLSAVPGGVDDGLGGEGWLFCDQNVAYGGEQVILLGAGFPPDARLPLGIYYQAVMSYDVPAQLVWSDWVFSDERGYLTAQIDTRLAPEPGTYSAIIVLEPGYQPVQGSFDPAGANACFVVGP